MLQRMFLDHPHTIGESYFEHQRTAFGFALALMGAGLACMVHGLVPGLFQSRASRMVAQLHQRMVLHRAPRATSMPSARAGAV
jgi:hypothetical protein